MVGRGWAGALLAMRFGSHQRRAVTPKGAWVCQGYRNPLRKVALPPAPPCCKPRLCIRAEVVRIFLRARARAKVFAA